MPVTPTFPGIYIEELSSSAHTVTAAPTSVTVFVGYTHPFKTKLENWGKAVHIFSFLEYETEFGGLYTSGTIESHLAYAVNQFFLNGGAEAWIVAIQPHYYDTGDSARDKGIVLPAVAPIGANGITFTATFTAKEPVDRIPMTVTINNTQATRVTGDTADVLISYGSRAESFRKVTTDSNAPNFLEKVINDNSQLVSVKPTNGATYGNPLTEVKQVRFGYPTTGLYCAGYAGPGWTTFKAGDFAPAFKADSSLDKVRIFNLMVLPGVADNGVWSEATAFCERKRAFLIMDPPRQDSADGEGGLPKIEDDMGGTIVPKSANSALYFPYLKSNDPLTSNIVELPPSGFVVGIFARTDVNRGVWKAPAGLETVINNTTGVVERGRMTDARQGTLNPIGVNCIRDFPGIGSVVFGARTSVADNPSFEQWRYVPVRRMALFLEQSLYNSLGWAVHEPNDEPLWIAMRTSVESFMLGLFSQGAFQGRTPGEAFQVKCDATTTTKTDINNGIVNLIVAFAPLKPAEFVIIKIAQLAGQTQR